MVIAECQECGSKPASEGTQVWQRKGAFLRGAELGIDIPGVDTMATAAKAIFYVGVGSALIVTSMFAWRLVDTFFGD